MENIAPENTQRSRIPELLIRGFINNEERYLLTNCYFLETFAAQTEYPISSRQQGRAV